MAIGNSARPQRPVADNRKARYNFEVGETLEVGIVLVGTEVKSLRNGKVNIAESYASEQDGEMWLYNADIPEYDKGHQFNHERRRPRKLLLAKRQINKFASAIQRDGMTVVPLKLYFNEKGRAKLQIALARGKKLHDKRATEQKRDWQRDKARLMRDRG